MAYTPELDRYYSSILRRIAWAYGKPMTKNLNSIFDHLAVKLDSGKICDACKDNSICKDCPFEMKGI